MSNLVISNNATTINDLIFVCSHIKAPRWVLIKGSQYSSQGQEVRNGFKTSQNLYWFSISSFNQSLWYIIFFQFGPYSFDLFFLLFKLFFFQFIPQIKIFWLPSNLLFILIFNLIILIIIIIFCF
jgi:hypothetical protein